MSKAKAFQFLTGLVLAGVFLWLALRNLSREEITQALADVRWGWALAALAAFFAGYACRIERWKLMLSKDNPGLHWRQCAGPFFACVAANNVLPLRAGDVLRAFAFNARLGIGTTVSVTSMFVERILDLIAVIALLGAALWALDVRTSDVLGVSGPVLALALAGLVALLAFPRLLRWVLGLLARASSRLPQGLGARLASAFAKADDLFGDLARRNSLAGLSLWTVLAWIAEGCVFWFAALALPGITQAASAWLAAAVGTLSTVIPSTPGYVGTFHYFTAQSMLALGNPPAAAAAYAILVHALLWLPATVAGGLYFLFRQVPLPQDMQRAHG